MFDLIVTDFNMPEVDGRELTKYIREQKSGSLTYRFLWLPVKARTPIWQTLSKTA